ncbi:putative transposase [Nitrosospira sp. Nsp11]|uniref:REP-associated tyrosine transposase n=1 Tax=Nitrosospira sp. Nsp11 TaxID=1855338 RepID=UPI0009148A87|nr:transposase [Nitrosospira sp. Nsp11]SHL17182.1 putative transposase [Nitrosospira sp. Nsp11]
MARLPRFILPGQPQHVILRGNNRTEIFCAEADYRFYFDKLRLACEKHGCDIHAYVLMTNHVHLLITPHEEQSLSKALQMLGRYYVQFFNHCYRRTGTLWEGRYKATLIDTETYLLTCMRYIELNPVRAGMVAHPSEYRWSSYGYNAWGQTDNLVTPHPEYLRLGRTDEECRSAYQQLFEYPISEECINAIREATNKAWVLGNDRFKQSIQEKLKRRVEPAAKGGDRRSEQFKIDRV